MKNFLTAGMVFVVAMASAQKPIYSKANVKAVTVYKNSAEIQNTFSVTLPNGVSDLIVTNVAPYADEATVRANVSKNLNILSIQRSGDNTSEEIADADPAMKKVRDSIKIMENLVNTSSNKMNNLRKTLELLDKNQNMLVGSNNASVAELMKFADYYQTKRTDIEQKIDKEEKENQSYNVKLDRLRNSLTLNSNPNDKIASGKLIFRIQNSGSGVEKIDFSYITGSVGWDPFYELKADKISDDIKLTYSANIRQSTGLDWKGVKLTLVNTNSGQMNQIPTINPWFLHAYKPEPIAAVAPGIRASKSMAVAEVSSRDLYSSSENTLSTQFDTEIPYDILSNGKNHTVKMMEMKIPAEYKYFAVPKQDRYAYLMAEISDYSKYNLLPGKANVIFENVYVGTAYLNPSQSTDKMQITLGKDERIIINREKLSDKSDKKILSSNIEQNYTFDITVRNNKKESITLELKDQYPLSQNGDVVVTLNNNGGAEVNPETGILTWKLKLGASDTKKIRVGYQVKYPKDMQIQALQ